MKKKFKVLALSLLSFGVLAACDTTASNYYDSSNQVISDMEKQSQEILETQPFMDFQGMISQETVNYQEAKDNLMQTINDHQIKIQYQDETRNTLSGISQNQGLMELSMTLKVKRENFTEAYNALQAIDQAVLITSNLGSEDLGDEVDGQANELEQIEQEIADLEEQIKEEKDKDIRATLQLSLQEAKDRRREILNQQAATEKELEWGTITYYLFERERIGNDENEDFGIGSQIGYSFNSFWIRTKRVFQIVIVFILNILPYLLVIFVLALLWRYLLSPVLRKIFPKRKKDRTVAGDSHPADHPANGLAPNRIKQADQDNRKHHHTDQTQITEETIHPQFDQDPDSKSKVDNQSFDQ